MKKTLLLGALFLMVCASAFAQVTTSNIRGTVVDDQGAPLLGANVVAVHTPTGTRYGAITNEEGRYNLLNLRVGGPYEVTVSYVGFKDNIRNDIFLTLGKTFNQNVALLSESQALDEVVVVSSQSGTFGSDRTGAETSVGRRELTRLPTISRSTNDFTRLEPTASAGSFGGRNDQYNNFSLDGAIFNNPFGLDAAQPGGQANATPISIDAIDQIQVSTAPYDVTQAGFTGASVNAVTKSGTNNLYGTAYGFFRNDDLTGGKINGDDVAKTGLEQYQYGFSIGGPIVKDKLFFFANFEKDELTSLGTDGFVPNRGTGAINESRVFEADLMAVQSALGTLGYDTGRYEGFNFDQESTKGILKLDWNINDNNRLAVIYNFLNASRGLPANRNAITFRGPSVTTLQFENSGYEINNNIKSVQLELNSTLSSEVINKLQMGYTHFDDFRNPFSTPAPSINITKGGTNYIIAGHEPFSVNNRLDQKVFQISNNLNYFKGNHTYTIGFAFEKFQFDNSFNLTAYGFDLFGSVAIDQETDLDGDGTPDTNYVNDATGETDLQAFQQFLVNRYSGSFDFARNTFNNNNQFPDGTPGGWALSELNVGQLSFYVQDEWNATDNFKLTYGIRFDRPLYFDTAEKVRENIARKGGLLADGGTYAPDIQYFDPENNQNILIDSETLPTNQWLISPRVGFNWDVNGDNSLQLRGGSGVFTGRFPFVWLGNQVQATDFFFYQVVDPDFKWPQVWRTNIGVDKRLENGLVLTADLSYTKDLNAAHVQNWGLGTPSGTLSGVDNRAIYTAGDKAQIFGGPTNAYVFTNSDKGRIINASVKAEKTWNNGLYGQLAYSYLDAKEVNSVDAEITGDAFNANAVVGNANTDVLSNSRYGDTHRFIGVLSKVFKTGTTISTFFEYAQGGRYNYIYGGDINNDGSGINDLLYIPTASEVNQMNFTGPDQAAAFEAFIQQDDYLSDRRGEYAERYGAKAPWRGSWDVKVLQDIKLNDKNKFQLSLDVLNIGNLINSNWGVVDVQAFDQLLGVTVDPNTNEPTFTFDPNLRETFTANTFERSRWRAQVGVRYIFN
ncbi:TonB-dependent receptor [Flagellimonas flava]|uniref:Carboxypeptidase regulatory-like domain-containing protein n=1 Tax=Flagellimonas flava TaxID=570519 RepID=A0A1M5I7Q6_9FLAO|nr:carboxypeptidase regulatory-like domain-containing protein [Allomuricauda flava]SHG24237.1 Carboxypeptidase regulatory-like domain-containing protein [Allomuricauda flava]